LTYRVKVDKQACMSAGNCVLEGPDGFGFGTDQLVELLPGLKALTAAQLRSIARNCPGQAIELVDQDGRSVDPFSTDG
jgi:ferredoxin